jgi:endonuclease/exonuclease/phosphatase family metal-dependent hydrolase
MDAPQLRVAQYNVLSQLCAQPDERGFPHVDPAHLKEGGRAYRITAEILRADADVVCMQEFDHMVNGSESRLKRALLQHYDLHGTAKPKHTLCVGVRKGSLWRGTTVAHAPLDPSGKWTQQWLAVTLRHSVTGHTVTIATTHFKSGADHGDTRLQQAHSLIGHLVAAPGLLGAPLVLCGDFNCEPAEPTYHALVQSPSLAVASAYAAEERTPGHITTHKVRAHEKCVCEDYILYTPRFLEVVGKRALPVRGDIPYPYLPNAHHGSDHLLLWAAFRVY